MTARILLAVGAFALEAAVPARAEESREAELGPYDPTSYLAKTYAVPRQVAPAFRIREYEVYVNGVRQRRFASERGVIDLPDVPMADAFDFRAAAVCRTDAVADLVEARREWRGDVSAYGRLIVETIRDKCPPPQPGANPDSKPHVDFGVTKKDKGRAPGETKAFVRDFLPGIFFERDF